MKNANYLMLPVVCPVIYFLMSSILPLFAGSDDDLLIYSIKKDKNTDAKKPVTIAIITICLLFGFILFSGGIALSITCIIAASLASSNFAASYCWTIN